MAVQSENSIGIWGEIPFLRKAVKYGLGLIVLIFYATVLLHFPYTPDDTFIYLQFAKNVLRGGGFAFNAQEPTYGVTSPLWTFIIAAGGGLRLDPYFVAKLLDLVFASLALIVFYLLAVEIIRERLVAFLATFVFSGNVWFIRWAATGMETSLSVLLLLLTVLYCLRNEYLQAALACSFLTLVRPEAALLFILLLIDAFLNTIEKRHAGKLAIGCTLIFLLIVGPWMVFAQKEFGTLVPNTVTAKTGFGFSLVDIAATGRDIMKTAATSNVLELVLVLGFVGWRIKRREYGELRNHFLPLAWMFLLPLVYLGAEVGVVSRYLLLLLPLVCVYGYFSLKNTLERFRAVSPYRLSAVLVVTTLLLIQNQYVYQKHVKSHMDRFAEGVEECLRPIAEWVRDNTPPGTVIVSPDVGAIGYWSDRKLCDLAGLITPEMKRLRRQGLTYDDIMTKHLFIPICYPEYVIDRAVVPERLADEQLTPLYTRRFYGLGLAKPEVQFYTLYRLVPGVYPKTELTLAGAKLWTEK